MTTRTWPLLLVGALSVGALSAACAPPDTPGGPVADVPQLMLSVIEPAAEGYWDAVGWILDENGTTEIRPRSPEEWEGVVAAAYQIAESGNLLMMEGRALDDGPWMAFSQSMIDVGRRAVAAAESEDHLAVFDAGAEVYFVCTACHAAYARETLRPNQTSDSAQAEAGAEGR